MSRTQTRNLLRAALALCAAAVLSTLARADDKTPAIADLAWLAGHWVQGSGDDQTEEQWLAPKGGLMLAVSRTVRGQRASFEFLRIGATDKGLAYFASPQGRPATEFPLKSLEGKRVVFENPEHDFPQQISYWLDEKGELNARVEGTIRGQRRGEDFHWKRVK